MSKQNIINQQNSTMQNFEISSNNIGNLLSYGALNLTLTLEMYDIDFIQNGIQWENIKHLSNLSFIKDNQNFWERIKLSSTEQNMQILLHMNKVLKEKIKIKHICFRKMKYKQNQHEFHDFLQIITNMNGLYLESHSVCKCELSIQLRLRYNGKRRLFVLCGEKTPLDDDDDEDNITITREDDNVLLEEGANYDDNQLQMEINDMEEEKYEIDEKKNDEDYNPFINLPKDINNYNEFFFIYFNYNDYNDGIFGGNITVSHLYKYFIFLKENCKARIVLNMMKETPDNYEEIRDLLSVSSITIFYDKNILFQLLQKIRNEEEIIKKEQEYFKHYYEKHLREEEIKNYFSFEEKREQLIQRLKTKTKTNSDSYQLNDEEKSFIILNKSYNKSFYSIKTSKSPKTPKSQNYGENKKIIIKKNKYLPPLSKVDIFNYYKTGICDKDPLKSKEQKIIIVLDDFYKVFIVQFNHELDKPFILDFDLQLYPQINVHNIPEVQDYKQFIRENFEKYIIIFIGYLLSSLAFSGGGGNSWAEETSLFLGYYGACKVLKNIILYEKNGMKLPNGDNFYYPHLLKEEVAALIDHAEKKKKEYKFILDCNNKNVQKIKLYNPLLDKYVYSYLNKNINKSFLKDKGFINDEGKLLYDPVYRESLLINKHEKVVKDEKKLFQTCRDFKKKNNFRMKEKECLNRYKNINDKLNKFMIGFRPRRPEYEVYLHNIKYNRFPLIFLHKNKSVKSYNFGKPEMKKTLKSFSVGNFKKSH